ncbi:MAG TPA: hypothetical protein VJ992_10080, partial [Gemmatimonadales bacterium]|nr:hypothetical protein [Gemmatimonadales bacterium]
MTERREFLAVLGTAAVTARGWTRAAAAALTVEAHATVFHRAPDGRLVLVRFTASGTDAIAGRLRVFDRRGHLMGTAGMLRDGDVLLGELWLPLDGSTRVVSALEVPGRRGPHRTTHHLEPPPKWTIHWLAGAPLAALAAEEWNTWSLVRGPLTSAAGKAGLRLAPIVANLEEQWASLDHVDLLRVVSPAATMSDQSNVPIAAGAVLAAAPAHSALALALAGSGVDAIVAAGVAPVLRLTAADGSDVAVLGIAPGAAPDTLALAHGRAAAARRIEPWLATLAGAGDDPHPHALIAGASLDTFAACAAAVREWTDRYAFPRIVMGDIPGYRAYVVARTGGAAAVPRLVPPIADRPSDAAVLAGAQRRRAADGARTARLFAGLAALASGRESLDALGAAIPFPVGARVVFNPSPFARSDVVTGTDGTVQLVTDVPGLGYAAVPTAGAAWRDDSTDRLEVTGAVGRVTVDPATGAIAAIEAPDGASPLGAGGAAGVVDGARLVASTARVVPDIARRLELRRAAGDTTFTTTVTTYDALPWVEIIHHGSPRDLHAIGIVCAPAPTTLSWETAGGMQSAAPPLARATMLHWVAVPRANGTLLVAASGAAALTCDEGGRIDLLGSGDVAMRIAYRPGLLADDAWRLGWSMAPFRAATAGGPGAGRLPSFGSLLGTDQAGVAVIDLVDEPDALVVYIQEFS